MRTRIASLFVAALFAAFTLSVQPPAQADTFGSGSNAFTIDFVNIGNAGNAADTSGYGAVLYEYRIGVYEISQDQIDRATASGMANVTAGGWAGNKPATRISWYEMAAFVNWLNTSSGYQEAYNLAFSGSWSMALWSAADAWTLGGTNLYRHKSANYFLPSENEWFKAASYAGNKSVYYNYATGSDIAPEPVSSGTNSGTAVYAQLFEQGAADVNEAGGQSPYGTVGQAGNVWEWTESALDGDNSSPTEHRAIRSSLWWFPESSITVDTRVSLNPEESTGFDYGFRVASIPEPSTYALLLMSGAGALWWARRKR